MEYIQLQDMHLSQIVLGTEGFGERIPTETAFQMMQLYLAHGGNVIDTARLYCAGRSEEVVGEFIEGKRDKVYISTKCAHPPTLQDLSHIRLSREEIYDDVQKSLQALRTDYIDILWLHRDDETKPVGPIMETLNVLQQQGTIRHFGASNWSFDRIKEANAYAAQNGLQGFCASQALYNLATRNMVWDPKLAYIIDDKEKYDKAGLPVFAYSSQAKGFFEKYANGTLSGKAKERYLNDASVETFARIKARAQREDWSISYAALKILREQSNFPVFTIVGPSKAEQLYDTLNLK